jgi:hypothetical protein
MLIHKFLKKKIKNLLLNYLILSYLILFHFIFSYIIIFFLILSYLETQQNQNQNQNQNQKQNLNQKENIKLIGINSETIVSFAIDKIISWTISNSFKDQIDKKIPRKCYEFMIKIINNHLKLEYLSYDRDDKNLPQFNLNFDNDNYINSNKEMNNLKKAELDKFDKIRKKSFIENSNSEISLSISENLSEADEGESNNRKEFLKTNESLMENFTNKFFDNFFHGVNEWSICEEPVLN